MMKMTKDETDLHAYVNSRAPKDGHLEFDFSDERQYDYAVMMTKKSFDTEKYPGLLKILELKKRRQIEAIPQAGGSAEQFQNAFGVTGLAINPKTDHIASNGAGTVAGGYQSLALTLVVTDANGNLVASGQARDLTGTLMQVSTDPIGGGTAGKNVFAQLFYSGMDNSGIPLSGQTAKVAYNTTADPVVTQPVAWCSNPYVAGAINIGLGRPWGDGDLGKKLDYIWNEPTQSHPIGKIPFVGSVTFNAPISSPLSLNRNILLQIYVANSTSGGASSLSPADLTAVFNHFSIDSSNPNKLNWNLPGGTSAAAPGDPIVFSAITWPTDIKAYFNCQIIVQLTNGTWASANIISGDNPDADPLDGTLVIKPISFVWHCLAEKTFVAMADGTKKAIRDIVAGDTVADGTGGTAVVEYTLRGAHVGSAFEIKTEDGRVIISSGGHVFMAADGPIVASELKVGDVLRTADGNAKISAITMQDDSGAMFCNLALAERKGSLGSFLAAGIVVGDISAQRQYRDMQKNDISWVKRHVAEFLHADVDSYFHEKSLAK